MKKSILLSAVFIAGHLISVSDAAAQSGFKVPKEGIEKSDMYKIIEHCSALYSRLTEQKAQKRDSSHVREDLLSIQPPGDTVNPEIMKRVRVCTDRFSPDDVLVKPEKSWESSDFGFAVSSFWQGGDYSKFFRTIDRMVASVPSDSMASGTLRNMFFSSIAPLIVERHPIQQKLFDSLFEAVIFSRPIDDITKLKITQNRVMASAVKATRTWSYDRALATTEFRNLVDFIDNSGVLTDTSKVPAVELFVIRDAYKNALSYIRFKESLDSLENDGPESYFRSLLVNNKIAGLDSIKELKAPVGRQMIKLEGKFNFPKEAGADVSSFSKPTVVFLLENVCRDETSLGRTLMGLRMINAGNCWSEYELIRYISEEYNGDVDVTVVTPTRGLVANLLVTDPAKESQLINDIWHGHFKLPVNIVVYETEFFKMPPIDNRREDLEADYRTAISMDVLGILERVVRKAILVVAPGGKVVAALNAEKGAGVKAKEILDPLTKWYRGNKAVGQSAGN